MPLRLSCPHCGQTLWVPDEYAGQTGACHLCGGEVQAPALEQPVIGGPEPTPRPPLERAQVTPPSSEDAWSVILLRDDQMNPALHARVLVEAMGIPHADAGRAIRSGQGILTRTVLRPLAEDVVRRLSRFGIEARAMPAGDIAMPPPATRVRKVNWNESTLTVIVETDRPAIEAPWGAVRVLHCGLVVSNPREASGPERRPLTPVGKLGRGLGSVVSAGSAGLKAFAQGEAELMADLVLDDPLMRLRLSPRFLDFAAMGPERQPTASPNYRLLLRKLLPLCTRARTSFTLEDLRDLESFSPPMYDSQALFDRKTEWLLNVALLEPY